jgi:hypothetical protein
LANAAAESCRGNRAGAPEKAAPIDDEVAPNPVVVCRFAMHVTLLRMNSRLT